jgi:DNA-binding IclR family transcriptional regulator
VASPYLSELSRQLNETVEIFLWDGTTAVLCQSYNTTHPLKVVPSEGTRLSMHNTSAGKIILADMTDAELDKYLAGGLRAFTHNTITKVSTLKTHLALVRKNGIAIDDEEFSLGVRGISVPIRIRDGKLVGVIGIIGPSVRLSRARMSECIPIVTASGRDICRELGYHEDRSVSIIV